MVTSVTLMHSFGVVLVCCICREKCSLRRINDEITNTHIYIDIYQALVTLTYDQIVTQVTTAVIALINGMGIGVEM